jgi:hypothetical protein
MKKTKKSPQPMAKAKPKVKDPSTNELPDDQLERVAGGAGTVAPTTTTTAAGNPNGEETRVGFTFQKIAVTSSTGGKAFTDDWET